MTYTKANLAVVKAASKDAFDRGFNGVQFEQDGSTVASNGMIMVVVGPTKKPKLSDFPGENGVNIPINVVDEVFKQVKRTKDIKMQNTFLQDKEFNIQREDAGLPTRFGYEPNKDNFPGYKYLFDQMQGEIKFAVNRKCLLQLLQTMEDACPSKGAVGNVFMEIKKDGSGMMLRSENFDTGQRAIGVIGKADVREWLKLSKWEESLLGKIKKKIKRKVRRSK